MSSLKSKQEVDTSKLDDEVGEFHVEQAFKASELKIETGHLTSVNETLSLWQTVKVFKVATAYSFAAAFSATTDGYQIGINGSIIANKGFFHQFATATNADGDEYLTAPILASWSSIMSVGQIISMLTITFLSDRYGRKTVMWTYWTILVSRRRSIDVGMISNGAAGWGFIAEISSLHLGPYTSGFGAACTCVAGIVMNVLTPYIVNTNKWNWSFKTGWFHAGAGMHFLIGT
ncbi:maltose permease [Fusarium sp. NRRL 52700]|nr:maltose permease [Fusarium sp. NRRL 52700]